jgi:hypothetical protein
LWNQVWKRNRSPRVLDPADYTLGARSVKGACGCFALALILVLMMALAGTFFSHR